MSQTKKKQGKKMPKPDYKWIILIFALTMVISGTMSFISSELLGRANLAVSFLILISIVLIGIIFDVIGVAVTSAEEKPFHSMASRKVPEAAEALRLIRNANRVSSFCNDVIGDICGVISGAASATIAVKGDVITDLSEDMAAEQKARTTYDNILRLSDDPDVNDVIRFLRAREVVHYQRFGEALRLATEKMDQKNVYAVNPAFDK